MTEIKQTQEFENTYATFIYLLSAGLFPDYLHVHWDTISHQIITLWIIYSVQS